MVTTSLPPIAVLGAGSWGTALALHLGRHHQNVSLWSHDPEHFDEMEALQENTRYLPNHAFPKTITLHKKLSTAIDGIHDILIAVPSHAFSGLVQELAVLFNQQMRKDKTNIRILWATKGFDPVSHCLLSDVAKKYLGENQSLAVLSGPSFAGEVARELPTAVVIATNDATDFLPSLIKRFNHGLFRVYASHDMIGVQIGGAVKNIIAIAAGACDGLNYGANAKSALITRGLAEITRLGISMGAARETFMGLSGMGDLVLTCTDDQSRNRRLGKLIANGHSVDSALAEIEQIVEGVNTASQALHLAHEHRLEMPICEQVVAILQGDITPQKAVMTLLARTPKEE